MAAELLLYDVQKGVNGFTNEPIRSSLVGYPPMIYSMIRMRIPDIAKAIAPESFVEGVQDFQEQVDKKISEQ